MRSGETDEQQMVKMGGTVFGYLWDPRKGKDELSVRFPVNLSRKLKVLMKRLYQLQDALSWDDPTPPGNRQEWIDVMVEALVTGVLRFPRSTRPVKATGQGPRLVGFGDGAIPGFGGDVYLQWEVVTSRLLLTVAVALSKLDEKPIGAVMMLDSRCVISALEATSGNLLPFFQNRIAEIVENLAAVSKFCEVEQVQWVATVENPADLLTRGNVNLKDLGPKSFHQLGPKFLTSPRDRWPVTRDFVRAKLPETEIRHRDLNFYAAAVRANYCSADTNLDISNHFMVVERVANYSNSLKKVQRILARVLRGWRFTDMKLEISNPFALTKVAEEPTMDFLCMPWWRLRKLLMRRK